MKEIIAVIRMNKMNATKSALAEVDLPSFTARKVMGRGKGKVDYLLLQGAEDGVEEAINQLGGPKMIPKRMITIVVPDKMVDLAIKTIIGVNQTGQKGDGKLFVKPVEEAIRVRTGDAGDAVLDENGDS